MARTEYQNPSVLERESAAGREWYIRYRVKVLKFRDGNPIIERTEKWKHLGYCAKMTKHQAEREKDKIMREVNAQVYTVQSQVPWSSFVEVYEKNHIEALAAPTQASYRQQLKLYVNPILGKLQLGKIGPLEVQQVFRAAEAAGLSRGSRQLIRKILASVFRHAKKWRFIDNDGPMADIDIGGGPRHVRECRVPALEDVQRLMDECEGDVPLLIETLVTTGMRISEAAGLLVSDLDFRREAISVTRRRSRGDVAQTKTEEGNRLLPMGDVVSALRKHVASKANSDPVFTYNGMPLHDNRLLDDHVTPRMERLGIKFPGFGWHTFRRLHLSLLSARGVSLFDIRRQAGHTDIRTTQRYIADDLGRRADAVAKPFLVKKGA